MEALRCTLGKVFIIGIDFGEGFTNYSGLSGIEDRPHLMFSLNEGYVFGSESCVENKYGLSPIFSFFALFFRLFCKLVKLPVFISVYYL
jgi:hypothetical protein